MTPPGSMVNMRMRSWRPAMPSISGPRSTVASSFSLTPLISGDAPCWSLIESSSSLRTEKEPRRLYSAGLLFDDERNGPDYVPGWATSGLAGGEVLAVGSAGELLAHQTGQEQQRAAWPVARHDVLGLPGGVSSDQNDTADRLAADHGRVVLEETVVAHGADEVELLGLIERADGDQNRAGGLGTTGDAIHRRAFDGDVIRQIVEPRREVVGETGSRVGGFQIGHGVPLLGIKMGYHATACR